MTIRIKPRKPVISDKVHPVRKVRRLMMNQTDYPLMSGCMMHLFVLGLLSATLSLTGLTAGVVMRFIGL
ncbi:hypothetical protein [Methanocalculus sp.]|uniref:hypothetical protein n=1 Tax=Methanocalculus sp. TaxID=2004547 RepID=UPI00271B411F|nr:hypothetical protein [Methanocalculus sp.]MDO8840819.1 hypothetical protein [Methanocalculus sp.]